MAFVVYMSPRQHYRVPLPGGASLPLGERTLIMGVINVTPDSFADGGERFDAARAVADGLAMVRDGADILDVGGESTRPGAEPVPLDEELRRVLPVVEGLAGAGVPLSVDTYKAAVAAEAIARGAVLVNDVSGLQYDLELGKVVAQAGAAIVLMHNRGRSKSMYLEAVYDDVTAAVVEELRQAMARAEAAGISREAIILDPGLGFAKRAEHTWAVARRPRTAAGTEPAAPVRTLAQILPDVGHRRARAAGPRLGHRRRCYRQHPRGSAYRSRA